MAIELTRDEAEELLKILKLMYTNHSLTKALADRIAGEPLIEFPKEPEPKNDGYCQACEGNHCTAKTGCVALSNQLHKKWEPQIERKYSPDGVLLSEKIKHTPDGEWQDLSTAEIKAIWNLTKKPSEFSTMLLAKIKERNYEH